MLKPSGHYVYRHFDDRGTFYIGKGKNRRAWSTNGRSKMWRNRVSNKCFFAEILTDGLDELSATLLEAKLIAETPWLANSESCCWIDAQGPSGRVREPRTRGATVVVGPRQVRVDIAEVRDSRQWRKCLGSDQLQRLEALEDKEDEIFEELSPVKAEIAKLYRIAATNKRRRQAARRDNKE